MLALLAALSFLLGWVGVTIEHVNWLYLGLILLALHLVFPFTWRGGRA